MANKQDAWEENVPGKWYVDKNCILCGTCIDIASMNFQENDSGDYAILVKQPVDEDEENECQDAMEQCPVEAIGNDGE